MAKDNTLLYVGLGVAALIFLPKLLGKQPAGNDTGVGAAVGGTQPADDGMFAGVKDVVGDVGEAIAGAGDWFGGIFSGEGAGGGDDYDENEPNIHTEPGVY